MTQIEDIRVDGEKERERAFLSFEHFPIIFSMAFAYFIRHLCCFDLHTDGEREQKEKPEKIEK